MFLNDITDYEEVIAQGADANIYGNFADIETLESDYIITDNKEEDIGIFKQGSILGKCQFLEEAFGSDNNLSSQEELNSEKSFDKDGSENEEEQKIQEI